MEEEIANILTFLKEFKTTVEEKFEQTNRKNEDTNKRIETKMEKNFENMKEDMMKMAEQNEKENNALTKRLAALEEDVKRLKFAKMKSPVRSTGAENGMQILPVPNQPNRNKAAQNQIERTSTENERNIEKNQPLQSSLTSWAEEQEKELERAAAMSGRQNYEENWLENQSPVKTDRRWEEQRPDRNICKNRRIPEHWFGDEESSCEESLDETSEDEKEKEDSNWQNIKRKEINKNKKKVKRDKQRRLKMETTQKAARMLGIGPIDLDDIEEHMGKGVRYEEAKMKAVTKYLEEQLEYEEDEIKEMKIVETKVAKDDMVYIAVEDQNTIRDLYRRKANLRNDDLNFRTFIPPQYYARYMAISNICSEKRSKNTELKTQMRFAHKDIEVLTKLRGENEPFRVVDLAEFIEGNQVPEFDYKIKWRYTVDKPRKKREGRDTDARYPGRNDADVRNLGRSKADARNPRRTDADAPAGRNSNESELTKDNRTEDNPLIRQRSVGEDEEANKRSKTTAMIIIDKDGSFGTPLGRMNISDIE